MKVSVCMTTYNHEKFISQAIDSVLMQKTDFDYELLIGEDDSGDQTRDIAKNFAEKYPDKIRLFLNDRKNVIYINGIPTGRWNFINLLKHARGEYVALLDGDDYWTDPLKLQKQIAFLENHLDYFLCIHPCEFLIHNTDGSIIKNKQDLISIKYEYTVKTLLTNWAIPTASIVYRKDRELIFPDWFHEVASGDIALIMLHYKFGKIKLIEDYMSVYRISGKGVSETHKGYEMIKHRTLLYYKLNEYYKDEYQKEIFDALFNVYISFSDFNKENPSKSDTNLFKTILMKMYRTINS
jgi:glycosyltransferase involved in cell wall biosynthesis